MDDTTEARGSRSAPKAPPRERILQAADELFVRYGIRGVGVEAIAEAADTNKMTLYRHFPSKDDLVVAWLERLFEQRSSMWERIDALTGENPEAEIRVFVDALGEVIEGCVVRGCPVMNTLAELPERDHPARLALDAYKAKAKKRVARFFRRIGLDNPAQATEEITVLIDGAKASIQDIGAAKSRARFVRMAKAVIDARMPKAARPEPG